MFSQQYAGTARFLLVLVICCQAWSICGGAEAPDADQDGLAHQILDDTGVQGGSAGPAIFWVADLRSQPQYHAEVMLIFKGCRNKLSLGDQDARQEQAAADPTPQELGHTRQNRYHPRRCSGPTWRVVNKESANSPPRPLPASADLCAEFRSRTFHRSRHNPVLLPMKICRISASYLMTPWIDGA